MKTGELLTLVIHGTKAPLYTNKIYPAPYVPLKGSNKAHGG